MEEKLEVVKKPYSKEKIGVTIMLVGLTAAIFLAVGYWAGTQSVSLKQNEAATVTPAATTTATPQGSGTASTTADATAGWKTYANDTYGFSFKYPADWKEPKFEKRNNILDLPGYSIDTSSGEWPYLDNSGKFAISFNTTDFNAYDGKQITKTISPN